MVNDLRQELQRLKEENKELRAKLKRDSSNIESFNMIVDGCNELVWEIDIKGAYRYISSHIEVVLGYTPEEMIGKRAADFMSEEEAKRFSELFDEIISEEESFSKIINTCIHKDGSKVYMETSGHPFYNEDGKLLGYRGIDFDRTQEENNKLDLETKTSFLQKELNKQHTLILNVIDSISEFIFYKDINFRYSGCNQAFADFVGIPMDSIIGKTDYELFEKEYADISRNNDTAVFTNKTRYSNYKWVTHSDGRRLYLLIEKSPLIDENDQLIGMVGISKDFTKNYYLEHDLEASNRKYKQLIEKLDSQVKEQSAQLIKQSRMAQMGELLSMIAHQWRQPLGSIAASVIDVKMKLSLSELEPYDEESTKALKSTVHQRMDNIEKYVKSLSSTIDDFRTLYKPNKVMQQNSIIKPIDNALMLIKLSFDEHHIKVVISEHDDTPIYMHNNEIMQVILNLLKNAQDNFIEKEIQNPHININISTLKDTLKVDICDNGEGVPDELKEKIFDPYFSTKSDINGTGLGLYMCKLIIEDHHKGKLNVFNNNEGACFSMELPLYQ